jgi:hypothetical protein
MTVCAAAMFASAANAATISGELKGLSWTAASTIIGVTPTGTPPVAPSTRIGPGGDPRYLPDPTKHSGTVALIMDYGAGGLFICSGSLMNDRRSIVTAGHCVSDGGDDRPLSTTAYFYDYATQPDERVPFDPEAVAVTVSDYFVNEEYTGEVIDQNDIAVLTLSDYAPEFAQGYDLYTQGDLTGKDFNVAGYGGRSTIGGADGVAPNPPNPSTGFLRQGDNTYDYRWGADEFGGFFTDEFAGENFFGTAEIDYSYVSDFDNGLAANNTACRIAAAVGAPGFGCGLGLGADEAGVAGGDSGGPGFIDGKLASVNSYGLTFGVGFGDFKPGLNSSFGEFSGYVPIFIHEKFIRTAMVPEPSTWALMISGFGLAGASLRRRRPATARA